MSLKHEARTIMKETGAIVECLVHSDEWLDPIDAGAVTEAIEIGHDRIASGELDATKEQFEAAVQSVLDDLPDECPYCAKNMDD